MLLLYKLYAGKLNIGDMAVLCLMSHVDYGAELTEQRRKGC